MKLATLANHRADGQLIVVSKDLRTFVKADNLSMRQLLENWDEYAPQLDEQYHALNAGKIQHISPFDISQIMAPLPRAFQFCDASAFLSHGRYIQKAFDLPPQVDYETTPLVYQGASDDFQSPLTNVPAEFEQFDLDFEGEFVIFTDTISRGTLAHEALSKIRLIGLMNDWSLRAFIQREMRTGFGFLNAKPSSSFAPIVVTPDELKDAWQNGKIHLPFIVHLNSKIFGHPNGDQMHFSFPDIIQHIVKTRTVRAGTIIGSGTVSNQDSSIGHTCISEKRAVEMIQHGKALTRFLCRGDRVRMEVFDASGESIFGAIDQTVDFEEKAIC